MDVPSSKCPAGRSVKVLFKILKHIGGLSKEHVMLPIS